MITYSARYSYVGFPCIGCGWYGTVHSKGDVGEVGMACKATQEQPEQAVSTIVNYDSDSTCDLEEAMNLGYESDKSNHSENIPETIDEVIESITPIAWLDNPPT